MVNQKQKTAPEYVTTVRTVERAIDLLEVLMSSPTPLSLTEISERVVLHPSTAHRLLATLDKRQFVTQNHATKNYVLGPKFALPLQGLKTYEILRNMAYPILQRTSEQAGEGASLCIRSGNHAICIAKVSSGRNIDISIQNGAILPLHATGVGKAILSRLPVSEVNLIIDTEGLAPSTANTITDRQKLLTVLKEARELGYATDYEEWEIGIRCIATPIFSNERTVVGAISVSGPTGRFTPAEIHRLASVIQTNGETLSRKLNFSTHAAD